MKKYLIILLSVICACCLIAAYGCSKDDEHTEHTWVATEETDEDGNVVYVCSECGETHTHTFSETEYSYDAEGHWHTATCTDAHPGYEPKKSYQAHSYEENSTECTVCDYDSSVDATYNIEFSYYQYDSNGDIVYDSTGSSYVEVGVFYTAIESSSGLTVDVDNGDTVMIGDVISFSVAKSVYCYYTDGNSYPVANVNDEVLTPDANGVYTVTIAEDMPSDDGNIIIWVSNVETRASEITGTGTENDPYTINTVTDWLYFASFINNKTYYGVSYNIAYWELTCDLDFEGEEIYVVGNLYSSSVAAFMGNFNGNGHTISNFVLTNEVSGSTGEYSTYLGLFGAASAYNGVSAVIQDLHLKDFTVNATVSSSGTTNATSTTGGVIAGTVVGYGVGFNLLNCTAEGGKMTVTGSSDYYSYVGGLVGILQSYVDEDNSLVCYSSMQYCSVSNTAITGSGVIYGAGGLVGYAMPYSESASVYIINSYVSGIDILCGMNAGGIAGVIGRYTTVQNAYATGNIIAAATSSYYVSDFEGTSLDSRYANAGGIVGYAENDTFIGYCFFVGDTDGSSATGNYVRTGNIYGSAAAAGFEEYSALAVTTISNLSSSEVSDSKLKEIGWSEADWVFGSSTYPTINTNTVSREFTITVSVAGDSSAGVSDTTKTLTVNSASTSYVYIPMSYRYLLSDFYTYGYTTTDNGIEMYMRTTDSSNNNNWRTYGYYFDSSYTQRVPSCYIPMGNVTIYAKYVDCSSIINKEYYITSNNVTATLTLSANGLYEYEEGAVYLTGTYEYDGTTITFLSSPFSRLSSDATENQASSYYTFYATVGSDGNLNIFDCTSSTFINSYGTSYDYLARFFSSRDPLIAVREDNALIAGKYYQRNENGTEISDGYVITLDRDGTGTYTRSGGTSGNVTYTISGSTVTVKIGNISYTTTTDTLSDGKITSLTYNGTTLYFTAYDDFEGTWEQAGLITKTYTFDGKGGWTYTYGTEEASGTYTVDSTTGVAEFTRNGIDVEVTINSDGTLSVVENSGLSVGYYAENSYAGVWYTYSYNETRYTLTLNGINSKGWGEAVYEGTDGFRYYAYSADTIYVYYGDLLYAQLAIDSKGVMTAVFYNSDTEAYDIEYTFYQYDAFYGNWVGSTDTLKSVSFNGFGMYNVAEPADSSERAVKGVVTINGSDTADYTVNMTTGVATFTYNSVEYTLTYNENTNEITVTYSGTTATLAEQDMYADVTFTDDNGNTYTFDGRGNLGNGVITITASDGSETTASYSVDSAGEIAITYSDSSTATIKCGSSGYVYVDDNNNETALYVENSFTGEWAIQGKYTDLVIGKIRYISVSGDPVTVSGTYGGSNVTLYYNGEIIYFSVSEGSVITTYYITALKNGLVLSETEDYTDEDSNKAYMTAKDSVYGTWTNSVYDTLVFDGVSGGRYTTYGNVKVTTNGETSTGKYYISTETGKVVVSVDSTTYYYTLSTTSADGAYSDGNGNYLVLDA
ncbi:MAG: hypothetical protein LUI60_04435 [Clostridia bacterium]|nr:hypothetical protein [Clostridia bacterium]